MINNNYLAKKTNFVKFQMAFFFWPCLQNVAWASAPTRIWHHSKIRQILNKNILVLKTILLWPKIQAKRYSNLYSFTKIKKLRGTYGDHPKKQIPRTHLLHFIPCRGYMDSTSQTSHTQFVYKQYKASIMLPAFIQVKHKEAKTSKPKPNCNFKKVFSASYFETREYLRAQKPCSPPPASQIRTAQSTGNALQSWGRPPVQILVIKRSSMNFLHCIQAS